VGAVEEVPDPLGVVAELELELVLDELGVVLDVGVLVEVLVVVVELDDELELLDVLVVWQSLDASSATVCAPCPRLLRSVGDTVEGSPMTALLSCCAALFAVPQSPADTA
jgi:hypothetical protein